MVIVVDAQERENEGDLICAAESITPEMVNFMLRQGAGVLCAPLVKEVADRLQLPPVVGPEENTSPHQTPFLIQVDHRLAGTGVSAQARAITLKALADPQTEHMQWVQPLTLPGGTQTRTFVSPIRLNGEGFGVRAAPPALGEHTEAIRARYARPRETA